LLSSRNQFAHFPPDSGLKTIGFFCNVDPHSDGGNGKQGLFDMIARSSPRQCFKIYALCDGEWRFSGKLIRRFPANSS
jgi:hypothetical protein